MKQILVLYYTQSGQLLDIAESIVSEVRWACKIDFKKIEPQKAFPFPWSASSFFDAMPESVLRVPLAIKDIPEVGNANYDLIILAYQPWFLSPSQPITGFLKSKWASVLKDKPVVTVLGTRNMWLNAQECVKEELAALNANLVGNIVFEDKHGNLTSTLTIIRWLFKGQKAGGKWLPAAGVSGEDIERAGRFGPAIVNHLQSGSLNDLQHTLLSLGAVTLHPNLITLEKRGVKQFPKFARKAVKKGLPGSAARKPVIKTFQYLLITAIFVLSPLTSLTAKIKTALNKKALMKEVEYFKGVKLEPGKLNQ